MSEFNENHTQLKALESECDSFFTSFGEFEASLLNSSEIEAQLSENLEQRNTLIKEQYKIAYTENASPTFEQQAQRHQTLLEAHRDTYKRLKSTVSQARARNTLLSNVRSDINAYRNSERVLREENTDAERYYDAELGRVNNQNTLAEGLLTTANEARAELYRQQQVLSSVNRRISRVFSQMPSINTILSKINTRQKRNSIILALIVVFCVLFILFVR